MQSKIAVCQSNPAVTNKLSLFLYHDAISILSVYTMGICTGKSLLVEQALYFQSVTYWILRWARETLCIDITVVSQNLTSYNYCLVEKTLVTFVIFQYPYQESL